MKEHVTIAQQFHKWRELAYREAPLEKGSEQYKQLRFAFFAGSASLLVEMFKLGKEGEDDGVNTLNRYMGEITGFLDSGRDTHNKQNKN